jgi:cystathionine beta-lyase family protein involved in aluminum resistance
MLKLTENDKIFIKKNFDNADEILSSNSLRDVLIALYDLIDDKGFAPPHYDEYNDFGREALKVYDSIYYNN